MPNLFTEAIRLSCNDGALRIRVAGLMIVVTALACTVVNVAPSPLPSPTAIPLTTADPTPPPSSDQTPTSPVGSVSELLNSYRILARWEDLPTGEHLVVLNPLMGRFEYLPWDGEAAPLVQVEGGDLSRTVENAKAGALALAMVDLDVESSTRIDVVDLVGQRAWGYEAVCDSEAAVVDVTLLQSYLSYRCSRRGESPETYHFVSLDDPEVEFVRPMPGDFGGQAGLPPSLQPNEMVYIVGGVDHKAACIGSLVDWRPDCLSSPYVLGAISPDGRWIEVRDGPHVGLGYYGEEWPERIGVIPADCLREFSEASCAPRWAETGIRVGAMDARYPATWAPDSSRFLLAMHPTDPLEEGIDLGLFDVASGEFSIAGRLPYPSYRAGVAPVAAWSPDGSSVMVVRDCPACDLSQGLAYYAFNVTDGSLSLLPSPQGWVIGTIKVP